MKLDTYQVKVFANILVFANIISTLPTNRAIEVATMMTHQTETPLLKRDSLHTISEFIWSATQGLGYGLAALSLYAIPMGIAYFIFQKLFN